MTKRRVRLLKEIIVWFWVRIKPSWAGSGSVTGTRRCVRYLSRTSSWHDLLAGVLDRLNSHSCLIWVSSSISGIPGRRQRPLIWVLTFQCFVESHTWWLRVPFFALSQEPRFVVSSQSMRVSLELWYDTSEPNVIRQSILALWCCCPE
jgi:hypothetical protein